MIKYIIIILVVIFILFNLTKIVPVIGNCGLEYYVLNTPDKQQTANLLCEINTRCITLLNHLVGSNEKINKLREEYDWDDLIESSDGSTYNVGKGEKIYLCMRNNDGTIVDINTLMFVVIHELAHIITKKYDTTSHHSEEFWSNNRWLLGEAIRLNLYNYVNYKIRPVTYCGMSINNTV